MCKVKIIKLIALFEYLAHVETSPAFKKILKAYNNVYLAISNKEEKNISEKDFKPLLNVYKIYSEARPKDLLLGKYVMDKMQEFYNYQKKIVEK